MGKDSNDHTSTPASLSGLQFHFHEGSLVLPSDFEDRTTNVFVSADPSHPNLSLARDWLEADESLDQYVDRQCARLKKQLPGLELLHREAVRLEQENAPLTGVAIDTKYKSGTQSVWQRQAAFVVVPRRVLIVTAARPTAPDATFNHFWQAWLAGFRLQ